MTDNDQLDRLLALKKNVRTNFVNDADRFIADFWQRADAETPAIPLFRRKWLTAAALFALFAGAALLLLLPGTDRQTPEDQFLELNETVRLFGGDAGVVFLGGELVTGERSGRTAPENLISATIESNGKSCELLIASADNDAVTLDSNFASGEIVVSRCDRDTIVLDIDVKLADDTAIRTIVPVYSRGGRHYSAADNS